MADSRSFYSGSRTEEGQLFMFPNPFLQSVIDEYGPQSPVATVKDILQPLCGYLRPAPKPQKDAFPCAEGVTKSEIIKCKDMGNQSLSPTLRKDVTLAALHGNGLFSRRSRRTV